MPEAANVEPVPGRRRYNLYILRCADGSLYTGIAIDIVKRLAEHENGTRGAKYLRGRGPLQIVFRQVIGDRGLASRVEHRVKRLDRLQKETLINMQLLPADLLVDAATGACQASGADNG